MSVVSGYVERIKYRNEENGYTILSVSSEDDETVVVGTLPWVSAGDFIEAEGSEVVHPIYGAQLQAETCEVRAPETAAAIERYLASGAVRGVGAALAGRIVRRFKEDTFRIIEEEPGRLSEVKGISEKLAMSIAEQMEAKKELRQALMFLQDYGISMTLSMKIYSFYGLKFYTVLRENPYQLAEDIPGIGFKTADEIAARAGFLTDADYRVKSGILYTLLSAAADGHTCLPKRLLLEKAAALLGFMPDEIEKYLMDLQIERKIQVRRGADLPRPPAASRAQEPEDSSFEVYASEYYFLELNAARMLMDLNLRGNGQEAQIRERLLRICDEEGIEPDELQIEAAVRAADSGLLILTGGPGTGKTTAISLMIRFFEQEGMEVLLAAPTGRAARRMSEATGHEARTVHRLLELSGALPDEKEAVPLHFERNEENPLEADAVIIDEASMVDIHLLHALLKAVSPGTRLIFVGDVSQLPSVGPGNVLRDMIDAEAFPVVRLNRIFRQAAQSDIVVNAHRINEGKPVALGKPSRDFLFIRRDKAQDIVNDMLTLVQKKLPDYVKAGPAEIQILTPMKKGLLGAQNLNARLQEALNPPGRNRDEKEAGGTLFRVGDKVMQMKNNYQLTWEIRDRFGVPVDTGTGIFNGDIGIIRAIDSFAGLLTVEYDEKRMVDYTFRQLDELTLAYAVTVHKSQGSEYPAVVMPVFDGPRMLMTRNLLYTAVTRAKSCVCLVGSPAAFEAMAANRTQQQRYTGLKARIQEMADPMGAVGADVP